MEYSDYSSATIKIESEDNNEEESFVKQCLRRLSYTLDLSLDNNLTEKTSCEVKPTLEYVKVNNDNSVVTNSDSPWHLASKVFPRSIERILNNCGIGKSISTKNVDTPEMNINKKTSIENKNVNLVNDQETSESKDKSVSETVSQFATMESDMLKKYKEKTKSPTDIQISQNKYGESGNVEEKNVDRLAEKNREKDKDLRLNIEAKSTINVDTPGMNINKKTSIENKNVNLVNDQKTSELKDKSASETVNQFATRESDMLKKYKEKTKSPINIQNLQNKYRESGNVEEKNVDRLVEANREKDKDLRLNMDKRKQENFQEIKIFKTPKTQGRQKKKRHQPFQGSFLNSDSELDHSAEDDLTVNSSNRKIYEQSEDITTDSQKNEFIPLIQEHESHVAKTKKKKNKKSIEKITYLDSDKCEHLDEENENLTEKLKNNGNVLFEESRICIDENEFVDLAKEEDFFVKKNKKKKHRKSEENEMLMENSIIKEHKQREQGIPYLNENEYFQLNEESESHVRKTKSKRHKELEEEIVCVDRNQLVNLDQKSENHKEKSNKKRKHEQFGEDISCIDNNQCVYLKEDDENFSRKSKKKKYRKSEESILYVDKDEFLQSNGKDGSHTEERKEKKGNEPEEKIYIDKKQIIHLDEENKYPTETNKNHEDSGGAISFIVDHESVHFAERNLAKKLKRKKDRRLEENEIVMEKAIIMKEYEKSAQSLSYVDKNGFIQLNEKGDSHTRKGKKKKHKDLEEEKRYIDNKQSVFSDEENKNLIKKIIKENKLEQSGEDLSFIDNNALVNLDEDNENFIKKHKKKKYRHLEENEIVMEKHQKKNENENFGERKKKKHKELEEKKDYIDNKQSVYSDEENKNLIKKIIKKNKLEHSGEDISFIDNSALVNLDGDNEYFIKKSKKKKYRHLEENEIVKENLKESISDNNEHVLMKLIEDNILDTNTSSPILKKEKKTKRKMSDKYKNKEDHLNIVKNENSDNEEDIFSGIFKSESSRETIRQNIECENTTPLLKKDYSKERENSVVIQEELSNNFADNVIRNIKNSPQNASEIELDKFESYTFSDILSQSHSENLMQKFNDIVNKSNYEKSYSEPRPRSQNHVSQSQLKQRTLFDYAKLKNDSEQHQKKLKIIDMLNQSKSIEYMKEELEMPFIEEQRKQVESLVIETDWPIPPIHRIAYFVNSCPSEEQKKALKSAGITWKLGKYTKEEDEQIIQNWAHFCKIHNWNEENYQPFLKCSTKTNNGILNQLQRRKFVHYISRGFENRLMYSVYHRFQRLFLENDSNTGRFTEEDDQIILEYVTGGNSNHPFAELVDLLKRSRLALIKRYKFIETKNKLSDEKVLWDKKLTETLLANLIEVTRSVKLSELKDYNVTIQEWKKVSEKMNIPVDKLKRAWTLSLYPRFFSKNYVNELTEVKKNLVDLIYIKYHDWREVNWNEVAEQLDNKFSGAKLCKILRDLIMQKVPSKKQNNLHQAMKYIKRHYQDWGMSRKRFNFVEDILKETRNVTVIPKIVKTSTHDENHHHHEMSDH